MNTQTHPNLFKNNNQIEEPNQSYYKSDYVKELLAEQEERNNSFQKAMRDIRRSFQSHWLLEEKRWGEVSEELKTLKEKDKQHQVFEKQTREWIMMLERNSQELHRIVEKNSTINEDILKEINRIHQSNEAMIDQLAKFYEANQQFTHKMDVISEQQQVMAEQVTKQQDKQDKVIGQLENQEALMEKSYRQLSTLRSILFERTSFVVEKIEESYQLTSSVLYQYLTGNDKPLTLMIRDQSKGNNNNG